MQLEDKPLTETSSHSHCNRGCLHNKLLAGCSTTNFPPRTTTSSRVRASLEAIKLPSRTQSKASLPSGQKKDRRVVGREMATHVEHLIPCQLQNPSTSPRSTETRCVLTWSCHVMLPMMSMHVFHFKVAFENL